MITRTSGKPQRPDETWQVCTQRRYHRQKKCFGCSLITQRIEAAMGASATKVGGTSKPTATMKSVEGWGGTGGMEGWKGGRESK